MRVMPREILRSYHRGDGLDLSYMTPFLSPRELQTVSQVLTSVL